MKFVINGNVLEIKINGELITFPNTNRGYYDMATKWWQWRHE